MQDQFLLTQQIDLKPLVDHLKHIQTGYKKIKSKVVEANVTISMETDLQERRFAAAVDHVAQTIGAGLLLLPQGNDCNLRKKRSSPNVRHKRALNFELDEQPAGTLSLFPSVGRILLLYHRKP